MSKCVPLGERVRVVLDESAFRHATRPIQAVPAEATQRRVGHGGGASGKPLSTRYFAKIISASSDLGEIILDPFCGCGTTRVAAQRLGRPWIGIDISPTAVNLMKRRLDKIGAQQVKLVGMPVTEAQLHALKPFEFQNWVIAQMNGTHSPRKSGDMGIDGYSFML